MSEWKKVVSEETWDRDEEKEITGVLVERRTDVGANNSNAYTIQLPDGKNKNVWGTTVLDTRMKNVKIGEEVRIEYLGLEPSKTPGRKPYHNFEVYHRQVEMERVEDEVKDEEFDQMPA